MSKLADKVKKFEEQMKRMEEKPKEVKEEIKQELPKETPKELEVRHRHKDIEVSVIGGDKLTKQKVEAIKKLYRAKREDINRELEKRLKHPELLEAVNIETIVLAKITEPYKILVHKNCVEALTRYSPEDIKVRRVYIHGAYPRTIGVDFELPVFKACDIICYFPKPEELEKEEHDKFQTIYHSIRPASRDEEIRKEILSVLKRNGILEEGSLIFRQYGLDTYKVLSKLEKDGLIEHIPVGAGVYGWKLKQNPTGNPNKDIFYNNKFFMTTDNLELFKFLKEAISKLAQAPIVRRGSTIWDIYFDLDQMYNKGIISKAECNVAKNVVYRILLEIAK